MTKFRWAPWPLTQLFQSYKQIRTAENYSCELYSSTARYICHSTARLFWAAQPQSFHRGLGTTTPGNQVCRHHFWRVSVQYESGKNITKRILVTDSWHAFIGFFCLKPTNITPKTPPRWECWYPFTSTFPPFIHLFYSRQETGDKPHCVQTASPCTWGTSNRLPFWCNASQGRRCTCGAAAPGLAFSWLAMWPHTSWHGEKFPELEMSQLAVRPFESKFWNWKSHSCVHFGISLRVYLEGMAGLINRCREISGMCSRWSAKLTLGL